MSMPSQLLLAAALLAISGAAPAQEKAQFGRPATPEDIASWDITVEPDGGGLPPGSRTAKQGAAVYAAKCQACHGENGTGGPAARLAGVKGTIGAKTARVKTIGTFWPYATTIFNYVYTAMPFQQTKSLTHDETYAVTAYLLYLNEIIGENDKVNAESLPKVKMPNRDYFVQRQRVNRPGRPERSINDSMRNAMPCRNSTLLEHFQEKSMPSPTGPAEGRPDDKLRRGWNPVFRPKMRQCKNARAVSVSGPCETALAALTVMLCLMTAAQAFDETRYPDLKGPWIRTTHPEWVLPGEKPAPLTPEYQAVYDANLAAQARGEPGDAPQWYCLPQGMPMMMMAYSPMEIVLTQDVTYVLISHVNDAYRRIYTDGRDWPKDEEPTYTGYSIGKWIDQDGDGRYDVLEIETRGLKNPRTFDTSGLPLHKDGKTIIKERLHLDRADRNLLRDDITVIDHALTRPWTVTKTYRRDPNPRPVWTPEICAEGNPLVRIGNDAYYLSPEGMLMPVSKDQPPPDLRYFNQSRK